MNNCRSITGLKVIPELKTAIDCLAANRPMTEAQEEAVLAVSVLLIQDFEQNPDHIQSLEFSYWIILSYSLRTSDYAPLYDFAVSFGLYPICGVVASSDCRLSLFSDFANQEIQRSFSIDGRIETIEQFNRGRSFIEASSKNIAYLAPTSFGKTELVLKRVLARNAPDKVCIVVPTKSLLNQTTNAVRNNNPERRVISHDEMYDDDARFIAVLTQERAMRLLERNIDLAFDELYIDEAHHLFDSSDRDILLMRLIKMAKKRNGNMSLFFLSPVISDASHLSCISADTKEIRIRLNMKEPSYRLFTRDGTYSVFNRFFGEYLPLGRYANMWDCILQNASEKNLVYVNSPKKIQQVALSLASKLPPLPLDGELLKLVEMLSSHVHARYDEIECVKHGVLYLHGQMPDSIKDYLEHKYNAINSIRFVVANTVVLEGVNLPIDAIFILSSSHLNERNLVNLVGRASRLNRVFGATPNLNGLMPKVVFLDNDDYDRRGGNMKKRMVCLRSTVFTDKITNPLIKKAEGKSLNDSDKEIVEIEEYISVAHTEKHSVFKSELYRLGFSSVYLIDDELVEALLYRIESGNVKGLDLFDLLYSVFIDGIEGKVKSKAILRFAHQETRSYYRVFLEQRNEKPLAYRVSSTVSYFRRKAGSEDSFMYVGTSFGEKSIEGAPQFYAYVDLAEKSESELVGLAIAKINNEEKLLDYTVARFVELMHNHELIDEETYLRFTYGTTDLRVIKLLRAGLTMPLINTLIADGQLGNVLMDKYGNLSASDALRHYRNNSDDFIGFEIEKLLM